MSDHHDSNTNHDSNTGTDASKVETVKTQDSASEVNHDATHSSVDNNTDTNHDSNTGTDASKVETVKTQDSASEVNHDATHSSVDNNTDTNHDNGASGDLAHGTPVAGTAPTAVAIASDGYAHQTADANHHDVQGLETSQNEIQGSDGNDAIIGGSQGDVLEGGSGSDSLSAGDGNDIVVGGGSNDTGVNHLDGGAGDDILVAAGHKTSELDALFSANAVLNAVVHNDAKFADVANILDGTLANAAAQVENDFAIHSGNGNDLILNFHTATDKIVLDHNLNGSDISDSASVLDHMVVNANNVTIDLGQGNSITLVGVDASTLSASDFVIV